MPTALLKQVDMPEGRELLRQIGKELDDDRYPVVHEGGQVEPGPGRLPSPRPGREDERKEVTQDAGQEAGQGPERSAARPRSGAADGGAAAGEGPPGSPAQVLRTSGLRPDVVGDLEGAVGAYPQMRIRLAPPLARLSAWIWPIRGLHEEALLLTAYPLDRSTTPRSWAWWDTGVWIGPRHTNYPDGSICAYEPPDGTWGPGRPLVELLDFQVVWIVRPTLFLTAGGDGIEIGTGESVDGFHVRCPRWLRWQVPPLSTVTPTADWPLRTIAA